NYKRNRHGRRDPVRQGRVFLEMMKLRELSQRGLADEMSITEGTVRNMLMYAEAADLRNSYAPGNGDAEIAKLSVRQVREYLELGEQEHNLWLDAGGSLRTG